MRSPPVWLVFALVLVLVLVPAVASAGSRTLSLKRAITGGVVQLRSGEKTIRLKADVGFNVATTSGERIRISQMNSVIKNGAVKNTIYYRLTRGNYKAGVFDNLTNPLVIKAASR